MATHCYMYHAILTSWSHIPIVRMLDLLAAHKVLRLHGYPAELLRVELDLCVVGHEQARIFGTWKRVLQLRVS
jgi:hypothetical protein